MRGYLSTFFFSLLALGRSRRDNALEILSLRQQIAVLKRKRPRPRLNRIDRVFWTALRKCWPRWADALVLVQPATVVRWHRSGWRLYWKWRSGGEPGRPRSVKEIRELIRRMAIENPGWGAPRIHGEIQKLGLAVSERTVGRYLRRWRGSGGANRNWAAFLENHREAIAAFDFFTVPTAAFRTLYCFFAIGHARRKVLHFNVTAHPTAEWVVQQARETFAEAGRYRYVVLDNDVKFGPDLVDLLGATGLEMKRTSFHSPWQNGVAERWVGNCRRELLDHVIPLGEAHLRRLLREYVEYYNEDRTHDGLDKDAPVPRKAEQRVRSDAVVVGDARLGGLHHRYRWGAAA